MHFLKFKVFICILLVLPGFFVNINYTAADSQFYRIHYDLNLSPDMQNFRFNGSVSINATVYQETDVIELSVSQMPIFPAEIYVNTNKTPVHYLACTKTESKCLIVLENSLKIKDKIFIPNILFSGSMRDDMIGFYKSSYFDKNGHLM